VRVALRQTDERPGYRLLVERSVALYLWDWLVDAMTEFTGG
jgi:sarcosine oxidase gamma subunit